MTALKIVLTFFLLFCYPPLLLGVINRTKAFFAGRKGPPLLQPYFDIFKQYRKAMVLSKSTSNIFRAGPLIVAATTFGAGFFVPIGTFVPAFAFCGDVLVFIYLLALARFFLTLAALDTGSAFEGMGAAREVTFACFSELALFFVLLILAKASGSISLANMLLHPLSYLTGSFGTESVLIAASLFCILLVENCRIPFDDPNTHLELTMIHEVLILDHSGPLYGLLLHTASVKLFLFSSIFLLAVFPFNSTNVWFNFGYFLGLHVGVAMGIGIVESIIARLRLLHISTVLIGAAVLSAFGFLFVMR